MWIVMNDSFVSIVKDREDGLGVVVRARVREDLVSLFGESHAEDIIETEDSDYRFRLFLDQAYVAAAIENRVMGVDYHNFKDSVKQSWRKNAYMKIWHIMYDVQENTYPRLRQWYENYRFNR
jgi:hypothetical protein